MTAADVAGQEEEDRPLGSADVIGQAGITYRQLDNWTGLGHLHPEGGNGSGSSRTWPPGELEIARRMGILTAAGISLDLSAAFARDGWPDADLAPGVRLLISPGPAGGEGACGRRVTECSWALLSAAMEVAREEQGGSGPEYRLARDRMLLRARDLTNAVDDSPPESRPEGWAADSEGGLA